MTTDIGLVLAILAVAVVLLITEWLRMDVVALLVLGALVVTGLLDAAQALSGFSNPAVVTVWAMFILSAALSRTGVAGVIGRYLLRLIGTGETRVVALIMLAAAVLSAFMNNIGVAALLLPVVMDVARRTGRPPSRLLMPLAFGSLLGGLTTLIGTPPNLLVSETMRDAGLTPFRLFDFALVGVPVMLGGIAFVSLVGRRWLPARDPGRESVTVGSADLSRQYALHERTLMLRIRADSPLIGKSLRRSRIGTATGLNVMAISRHGKLIPAPSSGIVLERDDGLLVGGKLDRFSELQGWRELVVEGRDLGLERVASTEIAIAELRVAAGCSLIGRTIAQSDFRRRFGPIVLAMRHDSTVTHTELGNVSLRAGDGLLVQGRAEQLAELCASSDFDSGITDPEELSRAYHMEHGLFVVRVPDDSVLRFKSLAKSRLGDALGLAVLGIVRGERTLLMPDPDERLLAGDRLLVRGRVADLDVFRGLQQLEAEDAPLKDVEELQSERIGLIEVILSPRTRLAGSTLRDLDFRERYGLQVLAILREGRTHRSGLRDLPLRFGDALLLFGSRDRLALLTRDPDFLVLSEAAQVAPRTERASLAALIMGVAMATVLVGWLHIAIAAVIAAALMIATGCVSFEEAYRSIEWPSVFVIAGMLPLGTALNDTGAAGYLVANVIGHAGGWGGLGVLIGLYFVTAVATTIIPTAALVVLMAPIALEVAAGAGLAPESLLMAVAIAASASFTSPIAHPANMLVMGPGGYAFRDYLRLGVPLALVVFLLTLLLLPLAWPLAPAAAADPSRGPGAATGQLGDQEPGHETDQRGEQDQDHARHREFPQQHLYVDRFGVLDHQDQHHHRQHQQQHHLGARHQPTSPDRLAASRS